ncbi:MAG: PQQ-binding-like beta-propeller repeat protein [Nitrososphaerota archaeon]|nr:PQQ-binding-like beta-propeller repeat protein [Candidatus Calditenuis fumarioli]
MISVALGISILSSSKATEPEFVNWSYPNADKFGANFSPQRSIGRENVAHLQKVWSFTLRREPGDLGYGAMAPPLVVNGTVYVATHAPSILALDAASGTLLWEYRPVLDWPPSKIELHIHGMSYYNGTLLYPAPDCTIRIIDAHTGVERGRVGGLCEGVRGNKGSYSSRAPPPSVDGVRGVMIWGPLVSGGTAAGRGFVAGISLTNKTVLWRWFVIPPAGGDPLWDFKYEVERGGRVVVGRARGNVEPFVGDWGDLGLIGNSTRAGGGISFGFMPIDEERGIVYLSTANPKPDFNATYRPGPNLFSSSIIALNVSTGDMVWYYQAVSHDLYDFDCAWNTVLAKVQRGMLVLKGCKNGVLYALNATEGTLLWKFQPPDMVVSVELERVNLTKRWHNEPQMGSYLQCPGVFGGIESDIALAYDKVYVAVNNLCVLVHPLQVEGFGNFVAGGVYNTAPLPVNSTIYAIDVNTGKVVWSHRMDVPYRGWLTVTNGMLLVSRLDGKIAFLDAENGNVLHVINVDGGSMRTGPVIGSDRNGRVLMLQLVELRGGEVVELIAFSLNETNVHSLIGTAFSIIGTIIAVVPLIRWFYRRRTVK